MMKTFRRALTLILSLMLIACFSLTVMAETDEYGEDYGGTKYTVRLYSGKEGAFSDGGTEIEYTGLSYGDKVRIDINSDEMKPVLNSASNGKYYPRGFKIAGHDNDEASKMSLVSYEYTVTGDASFSVAYGMKGAMVKYTVNYVDENGKAIHPSEEFYGMAGDYPVVSYQYVEGYTPDVTNLGKTLTDNEADNVFTFTYTRGTTPAANNNNTNNNNANNPGAANANANAAGNANANAGAGAGAGNAGNAGAGDNNAATIGDDQTPAAGTPDVVDLDEGNVPMSEPEGAEATETTRQFSMSKIIAGACAVLLAAALAVVLIKRRSGEDDDDEDDGEDTGVTPAG